MQRVVILGTGTGVGKTRTTTLLAEALGRTFAGDVLAVKPVETGIQGSPKNGAPPKGSDAALLEGSSRGRPPRPHPLYRFRDPVSPHLAARRDGTHISASRIRSWLTTVSSPGPRSSKGIRVGIDATHRNTLHDVSFCLVETAGGAFSPLGRRATNVDLARALEPAIWVLVAPDSLGVLHDLRACCEAMQALARAPDYLVLSAARPADAATGTHRSELPRVGLPRPIAVLARGETSSDPLLPLARALVRRARSIARPLSSSR